MSFFNRFRDFPEYYDLLVGIKNYQEIESDIYVKNSKTFGPIFDNFINAQQDGLKVPLGKVKSKSLECINVMNAYQTSTLDFAPSLATFLEELHRLQANAKIAMEHTKRYRKDQEAVNKLKSKIRAAKAINDHLLIPKLEDKLSLKEDQLRTNKHFANELRAKYIQDSDSYKIEFPINFGQLLKGNIEKRKTALRSLIQIGDDISSASAELTITNDSILDELRNELELLEDNNL